MAHDYCSPWWEPRTARGSSCSLSRASQLQRYLSPSSDITIHNQASVANVEFNEESDLYVWTAFKSPRTKLQHLLVARGNNEEHATKHFENPWVLYMHSSHAWPSRIKVGVSIKLNRNSQAIVVGDMEPTWSWQRWKLLMMTVTRYRK